MAKTDSNKIDLTVRYGTIIVLLISSLFFFPSEKSLEYAYDVGQITTEEIIAPFDFPILKMKKELEADRAVALAEIYPLFVRRDDLMLSQLEEMNQFFDILRNVRSAKSQYGKNLVAKVLRGTTLDSVFLAQLNADSAQLFGLIDQVGNEYGFDISTSRWNFMTDSDKQPSGGVNVL